MKDEETDEDGRQGALLRGRKKAQGLGVEVAEAGRGDRGRTVSCSPAKITNVSSGVLKEVK